MDIKDYKLFLGFLLLIVFIFTSLNFVSAGCWQYTNQTTCESTSDSDSCRWKNDQWGSWCEELNCWSLYSQTDCTTTSILGKNCTWQGGGTSYGCEKINCWSFSGTNSSTCENNTRSLNCQWNNYCYSTGGGSSNVNCWESSNQSACLNVTGCAWGQCMERGCSSYTSNATCNAAKDWNGRNCTWNSENNYCNENGCWKYGTNNSATASSQQSECQNTTITRGLNCEWKWNSCQEKDCYSWDYTNETACVNNTVNLSCSWSNSWCMKKDCWSYNSQAGCQNQSSCLWKTYQSSGWCNEVNCWTWDSMNGGNRTQCENNSYGLSCSWAGNPTGNITNGWCYKNIQTVSCSNYTTERACMDTYYCWWQYIDWNNVSAGGTCNTPGSFGGVTNITIFNEWNPGCYIFDKNSSDCNNVLGCNYSSGECVTLTNAYGGNISANGINCTYINTSSLCNSIPALSSCCSWQNGSCVSNKLSSSCRDQMQAPPAGASFCEDYSAYENQALCEQIAGSPWYMPCEWSNATSRCGFKASDVFGNESQALVKIDNKKNCEAAGGKWITENYCEGNVSVPTGRCESKFNEEDNCDKTCFGCELKDSNGNSVNATNAESACKGSKLGFCEFTADTRAKNGIGYCKAKEQYKKGIAGNCDTNCGDCSYKGDPSSNTTGKRPVDYCTDTRADRPVNAEGGCKWVSDNSTAQGGYCVKKSEKTCQDACDRCTSQITCQDIGRTAVANQSGSCKWQTGTSSCVSNTGEDVEICWDGIDNNNNNLIDCSDQSCFSDSFCGFVIGDCVGWTNNNTCITNNCEWITDKWGSWCDVKGGQCWKYDFNSANCTSQSNCRWQNGTGNALCERDWKVGEVCMGLERSSCIALNASGCNWTVDTWCSGTGNGTDWCRNHGGWCDHTDFAPKNCWLYTSGLTECNSRTGCGWRTDSFTLPHCEVNWSANCGQFTSNGTCSNSSNCEWEIPSMGGSGWGMNKADKCGSYTQANCVSSSGGRCYWESWGGGGGFCQSICFNQSSNSQSGCNTANSLGCVWKQEGGWCEESSSCTNSSNSANQNNCQSSTGCRWKSSGWCEPKSGGFSTGSIATGGGVGTGMGGDCYKYDGNRTFCTNKTIINISCGWTVNPSPKCEVDWSKNCWMYVSVATGCNATNGCWFKNDSWGNFCTNIVDQCWQNQSLQTNSTLCSQNLYCTNTSWGGCEPKCFSQNATSCNITFCKYPTGWCNPKGMNDMFDNMEAGAPVPLGVDNCTEGIQASVDLCGFGMKDMGNAYGFGAGVRDFSNASICNKERLSSFVMGMAETMPGSPGGMGTSFGAERTGNGNDTVIFLVYLDADGSQTGGCALDFNSSALGYEFRFKYTSQWNANTSKASETFNAYKCEDSSWKATDIKLNAWKKKMCSDIGGPMVAIEKSDLGKYPNLYNSTKDMRIYVATIGNIGNISSPLDSVGPGWTTPGSIDFEIKNAFEYGADIAKFEDILKKGFVKYEDCFNGIDDDADGNTDCSDWNCEYSSNCANTGVNAANYADTSSPLVTGVKIEEYPDAALVMYDTNKPTNGSLELYGYGDTQCLNRTNIIYDIGILKNNTVRIYKLWHTALIYNTNETANGLNVSINWPLAAGSSYNYKLKICDSGGKCSISKCSSLKTPVSAQKCGYCNFVARIKAPTGWNVSYDVDRNGTYEHLQGQICGPNAGMKTNYTDGRRVNIKLAKSDGSVYFEFLNASLTKTGLNDKVRTISNSTDLIYNTSTGTVGMISDTRDKIINNLHPEVCRVKIPATGTCNELYHCDDSGNNCTNRTSAAGGAPIDSVNCVWNVPYCEFSTYRESTTTSSGDGGTTSSSSGGGGGGAGGKTYIITETQFKEGYTQILAKGDKIKINISGETHSVMIDQITETNVRINISSVIQQATFAIGDLRRFDVTDDGYYDMNVKLNSIINKTKADITIKSIYEQITPETKAEEEKKEEAAKGEAGEEVSGGEKIVEKKSLAWLWILIGIVVVVIIIVVIYSSRRRY